MRSLEVSCALVEVALVEHPAAASLSKAFLEVDALDLHWVRKLCVPLKMSNLRCVVFVLSQATGLPHHPHQELLPACQVNAQLQPTSERKLHTSGLTS